MTSESQTAAVTRGVPLAANSGEMLARLEKALLTHNISPHPTCRYATYRKILQARSRGTAGTSATQEQLYATAELFQMDWILACFAHEDSLWPAIERAFFRDPTVPSGANVHSPGRDLQFELYIAARLRIAGFLPQMAEPDIRTDFDGWPFCVACKRVKSRSALTTALRGARNQISQSEVDGIIALDFSFIAAADNFPYAQGNLDTAHAWMQQFSKREFHARWHEFQRVLANCSRVVGVVVVTRLLYLHLDDHTHLISELLFSRPTCAPNDRRFDAFIAIENRLRRSVLPEGPHTAERQH